MLEAYTSMSADWNCFLLRGCWCKLKSDIRTCQIYSISCCMITQFACVHEVRCNILWCRNVKIDLICVRVSFTCSVKKNFIFVETTLSFDMYLGNKIKLECNFYVSYEFLCFFIQWAWSVSLNIWIFAWLHVGRDRGESLSQSCQIFLHLPSLLRTNERSFLVTKSVFQRVGWCMDQSCLTQL